LEKGTDAPIDNTRWDVLYTINDQFERVYPTTFDAKTDNYLINTLPKPGKELQTAKDKSNSKTWHSQQTGLWNFVVQVNVKNEHPAYQTLQERLSIFILSRNDQIYSSLRKCDFDVPDIGTLKDIMLAIIQLHKKADLRDFTNGEYSKLFAICIDKTPKNFWPWLGSKLEIIANDESARLLFNAHFLFVCDADDSEKLLKDKGEGTVVLRFAITLTHLSACFVIDSIPNQSPDNKPIRGVIRLEDIQHHGHLCYCIQQLEQTLKSSPPAKRQKLNPNKESINTNDMKQLEENHRADQSTTTPAKPCKEWTTEEVKDWVQKCEDWKKLGLPEVPQEFFDQDVNGAALVQLSQDELENRLGIKKIGPLKRIIEMIKSIKEPNIIQISD